MNTQNLGTILQYCEEKLRNTQDKLAAIGRGEYSLPPDAEDATELGIDAEFLHEQTVELIEETRQEITTYQNLLQDLQNGRHALVEAYFRERLERSKKVRTKMERIQPALRSLFGEDGSTSGNDSTTRMRERDAALCAQYESFIAILSQK